MSDSYTKVDYVDVEPKAPGMYFLRDALDTERLGFTVVEVEAGWTGMEHDHDHDDQEEIYHLVEGRATVTVDGDDVSMTDGDTLRVGAGAVRQLQADADCYFVVVGAP